MNLYEQIFNLAWILLGMGICTQSIRLKLWEASGPGSGFISFLAGILLGVVGLLLFVSEWSKGSKRDLDVQFWQSGTAPKRITSILAGLCVMAYLMPTLGFLLSSILIMTFMLRVIEPTKWITSIALSLVFNFLAYWLFSYFLEIELPKGFVGV
jgi:hypothetical protein